MTRWEEVKDLMNGPWWPSLAIFEKVKAELIELRQIRDAAEQCAPYGLDEAELVRALIAYDEEQHD